MYSSKLLFIIAALCTSSICVSQVGINTTTPDPSSMLDIVSSDKGLLAPRVSLDNITTTMLDGVHVAANGLLIYNTNATIIGGAGAGFYVFNGTQWEKVITSNSVSLDGDADFFQEGTTNSPNSINDDIYTQGNVAIGKTNALYAMDIVENTDDRAVSAQISGNGVGTKYGVYVLNNHTGSGSHYGTINRLSGAGVGIHYGSFQDLTTGGTGAKYGVYNRIAGSGNAFRNGVYNWVTSATTSPNRGTYNYLDGTGSGERFGTLNSLRSNSSGRIYGTYNDVLGNGTQQKFGSYNIINAASGGTHYGIYSDVAKSGSFSGFFKGAVAIGTTPFLSSTPDYYIMPTSRGTANQIMQTDASGNVSWVDAMSVGGDADFYESGTTNAPGAITDAIFHTGDASIGGDLSENAKLAILENSNTTKNALNIERIVTANPSGLVNALSIDYNTGFSGSAIQNNMSGSSSGARWAITNRFDAIPASSTGIIMGVLNNNFSASNARYIGMYNNLGSSGAGLAIGMQNNFTRLSTGVNRGVSNLFGENSSGGGTGIYNLFESNNPATSYYGSFNDFITDSGGTQYGLYNIFRSDAPESKYGTYTQFTASNSSNTNGELYGHYVTYDPLNTTAFSKYGFYANIPTNNLGTNYGIYSDVLSTSGFAGYFLGNVSIGTTASNNYILPRSRGTANQIMQTDGAGNVSWQDAPTTSIDWSITGNLGTSPTANFLGTTDNVALSIRTNNTEKLRIDTNGIFLTPNENIKWGAGAGQNITTGSDNILLGANAGATITSESNIVAIGNGALQNTSSFNNLVALGPGALQSNTMGSFNLAVGVNALNRNVIGNVNTAIGTAALVKVVDGSSNTAVGHNSMIDLVSGGQNTAVGTSSGRENTGSGNTLMGYFASYNTTAGDDNTVIGKEAARNGDLGNNNVLLGASSGRNLTGSSNVFLGNLSGSTLTNVSNKLIIDNSSSTSPLVYGEFNTNIFRVNGRLQVGDPTGTGYRFPNIDGTTNQIMQTDGAGNVSWIDVPTYTQFWSRTGTALDVATAADDITFASDQTSITFAQAGATPETMIYMFNSGITNTDRMILSQSPAFAGWGLQYRDSNDSFVFKNGTNDRVQINLVGTTPLRVFGTTRATDFESDTATYPDYVFQKYYDNTSAINPEYQFSKLSEVEVFIKNNGHLPGVKSYEEVQKDGMKISLSETSIKNLEKIEELFLYTIEISKENELLKAKLAEQEERLDKIEQLLLNK